MSHMIFLIWFLEMKFLLKYMKDDVNETTEIPNNGSSYQYIKHFTFEIL